jgi:hypothetical protein
MSREVTMSVRASATDSRRRGRRSKLVDVFVLLTLHTLMLAWGAWRQSPTIHEVAYLPAGISHWQFARFDLLRVNPPLVRLVAALPVIACQPATDWTVYSAQEPSPTYRADFDAGRNFLKANGSRVFRYFTLARWACIPFSLLVPGSAIAGEVACSATPPGPWRLGCGAFRRTSSRTANG